MKESPDNQDFSRLKSFRQYLDLNQEKMAESVELTRGNYARMESGRGPITYYLLNQLLDIYNLNPLWLMRGKGEMFIELDDLVDMIPPMIIKEGMVSKMGEGEKRIVQLDNLEKRMGDLESLIRKLVEKGE